MRELAVPSRRGRFGTATNGTYVPDVVPFEPAFWRVLGLYLAEGHIGTDGQRTRVCWSFHPTAEAHLVDRVASYWQALGVNASVRLLTTTCQISISSRLLGAWFEHGLRVGRGSYDHALPDQIWGQPDEAKRALLRGLWDRDGSWSLVNRGPSVVLEYGTVSRALADGMLRLLADLRIVARLKVGRSAKSTADTYWLVISGADQVEECLWLLPRVERAQVRAHVRAHVSGQSKRLAPTGYRRLTKNAAWVRVLRSERRRHQGDVFSVEVPGAHTVVSSFGLVTHNCFPKDSRALIRIAEDAGYHFDLLKGVVTVNEEQFERVTAKTLALAGGSVDGVHIAAWGLTFKARTDDLRESPALAIIGRLRAAGARVVAYDPSITFPIEGRKAAILDGIQVAEDQY
jgi:UDPglucose 6-dehydrogenase